MTHDDMLDLQADILDVLQNDVEQSVVYRYITDATTKDAQFGFVTNQVKTDVTLYAVALLNPDAKIKKTFGVSGDTVLVVYLATKQLLDLSLVIHPEKGTIVFLGAEYEIEKVTPMPVMADTSVVTVLGCKEAKPNV